MSFLQIAGNMYFRSNRIKWNNFKNDLELIQGLGNTINLRRKFTELVYYFYFVFLGMEVPKHPHFVAL